MSRRGIALPLALGALTVVAALVAGALFVATEDQRVAENTRAVNGAVAAAEAGAHEILGTMKPGFAAALPIYPRDSTLLPAGRTAATLYRLGSTLYLLEVSGSSALGASAGVGITARADPLEFTADAALTVEDAGDLKGVVADGRSHTPPGWHDCDSVSDTVIAGVRTSDSAAASADEGGATGNPPIRYDPSAAGPPPHLVRAPPNITLPAGRYRTGPVIGPADSCKRDDPLNWGDGIARASPCASYYPIVQLTGNAVLEAGQGQGILLVDGDLEIAGPYDFFGVAIVRGVLQARAGARFWGAVFAARVSGVMQVSYSKCSIAKSLHGSATLTPIRSRHWNPLFRTP